MDVCKAKIPPAVPVGKLFVIDAHQMKYRGMQIMNVDLVLHRMPAKFIRGAIRHPSLDPTARQPHGETKWMMLPTVGSLRRGCPPELAAPHHQRVLQKSPRL